MIGAVALFHVASAEAQQNNRPFSFGGGSFSGGSGISFAGRQAILNQQFFGAVPNQLVTGPGGSLLNVQRGPGGTAIVSTLGGAIIPQFRGSTRFGGSRGAINGWTSPGLRPGRSLNHSKF